MTDSENYRPKLTKKQLRRRWKRESEGKKTDRRNPKLILLEHTEFLGFMMSITAVVLFIFWLFTPRGKVLFEERFTLEQFGDSTSLTTKVFELNKKMNVCQLSLEANISTSYGVNTSAEFGIELYDEDEMVNTFEGEFWYEWGYDEGERWQESSTSISKLLQVANTQKYRVEISKETINVPPALMDTIVSFKVKEGSALKARYYGWSALVLVMIAIIVLVIASDQRKKL